MSSLCVADAFSVRFYIVNLDVSFWAALMLLKTLSSYFLPQLNMSIFTLRLDLISSRRPFACISFSSFSLRSRYSSSMFSVLLDILLALSISLTIVRILSFPWLSVCYKPRSTLAPSSSAFDVFSMPQLTVEQRVLPLASSSFLFLFNFLTLSMSSCSWT